MPISYNYSGNDSDNKKLFRKFSLDSLLLFTANFSSDLLMGSPDLFGHSTRRVKYTVVNAQTKERSYHELIITGWDLIDLSYYAVLATNDFRGKSIECLEEFYLLCSAIRASLEKRESAFLEKPENGSSDFILYLWGFCGEQFKFQSIKKCLESFARDLYLLIDVSPKINGITNIHDIIRQETGADWITITTSLLLAWFGMSQKTDISTIEKRILWDEGFTHDNFISVINRYTTTYSEIRTSCLKRQIFYTKPFIKTEQSGKLFCVNSFLGLFLLEHSIMWIIRDYYKTRNDRRFTSEFGIIFEAYLQEVFSDYLPSGSYEKIPESYSERADWVVYAGEFQFLVEQKSASLALAAKQQDSDLESIKHFAKSNIFKAMSQLHETEIVLNNGKYIKIILLYEDYLEAEALDALVKLPECPVKSDNYYWIMNIDEMEMLLSLYAENQVLFTEVIREKITREINQSPDGKSLRKILSEKGIVENNHVAVPRISRYREDVINNARLHLGHDESRR